MKKINLALLSVLLVQTVYAGEHYRANINDVKEAFYHLNLKQQEIEEDIKFLNNEKKRFAAESLLIQQNIRNMDLNISSIKHIVMPNEEAIILQYIKKD